MVTTVGGTSAIVAADHYTYVIAPVITSANTVGGSGGSPFSYQITASNLPTSYNATGLPAGVTVNTATGLVSGTPTVNGTFNATIYAGNAAGTGSATLTITLTATTPAITSAATATGSGGSPFSYQITANNVPTSFGATGLPAGVTVDIATGLISGTPTVNGTFNATISATNASGTGSATLTITLSAIAAPAITSAMMASVTWGVALSYQITASNVPTSFGATGLPAGVTVNTATGLISGTATASGTFNATISATNAAGTGSKALTITIGTQAPVAASATMTAQLNTPATLDLAPFITGSGISGINVVVAAKHGTVTVNGTKVTYTPVNNYFGTDAFSYAAYGNAGTSAAAVVTVTIVGRPDPTRDVAVTGLLTAQSDTAQRFSRAQISNFQHRMESLHRSGDNEAGASPGFAADAGRTITAETTAAAAVNRHMDGDSDVPQKNNPLLRISDAPAVSAMPDPAGEGRGLKSVQFANNIVSLLTTQSINLSMADQDAGGSNSATGGSSYWVEGTATFGMRDATGSQNGMEFTTSGISVGVDRRLSDKLTMGVGVGFARDKTDIGNDGSHSNAHGSSITVYGSYQPSAKTFVDALIGYGSLKFETQRYVASVNDFARGDRDGYQVFSSLASGYEYRDEGLLMSPYARLDYSADHLNQGTETGAGANALVYFSKVTPTLQGALGVRAEAMHDTSFGTATPRIRAEYRHDFQGERQSSVMYADLIGGPRYATSTGAVVRNSFVLGVGDDFVMRGGLSIGIDYQMQNSFSSNAASQSIGLKVTQDIDKRGGLSKSLGIQTDFGFMYDDNVTRAKESADKLGDRAFSANLSKVFIFPVTEHARTLLTGSLGGEKFDHYSGLSHASGGVQGEYQYRSSAEFGTPTFAVFAKTSAEQYESVLRDGYRYSGGVSVREPVTDRIRLFGALAHNVRKGKSAVFDTTDNSARMNLDYAATPAGTMYLGGELRRGDIVSTGTPSLQILDTAKVFVQDDAYPGGDLFSYRFDARTVLTTLGYNIGFGPRDSIDFSWRRVKSTPVWQPKYATSSSSYVANQYSVVYLVTF